jgi:hypothetical protein
MAPLGPIICGAGIPRTILRSTLSDSVVPPQMLNTSFIRPYCRHASLTGHDPHNLSSTSLWPREKNSGSLLPRHSP